MRTRLMIEKPDETLFTLKIEASAAEFCAIRDDLDFILRQPRRLHDTSDATKQLKYELNNLLGQARKIFYPDPGMPLPPAVARRPDGTPIGDDGPMER